jgi:hypothetical protein
MTPQERSTDERLDRLEEQVKQRATKRWVRDEIAKATSGPSSRGLLYAAAISGFFAVVVALIGAWVTLKTNVPVPIPSK